MVSLLVDLFSLYNFTSEYVGEDGFDYQVWLPGKVGNLLLDPFMKTW